MLSPGSIPISSKEDERHIRRLHLELALNSARLATDWEKNCSSPQLLSGSCPDMVKQNSVGIDCTTLPIENSPILFPTRVLAPRKACQIFWAWQSKTDAPLRPWPNDHGGTWDSYSVGLCHLGWSFSDL